jgi:hypothetical protein
MSYAMDSDGTKLARLRWTLANVDKKNPNIPYLKKEIKTLEGKLKGKVGRKNWKLVSKLIDDYYKMTYGNGKK